MKDQLADLYAEEVEISSKVASLEDEMRDLGIDFSDVQDPRP